jgi:hypothetical protein
MPWRDIAEWLGFQLVWLVCALGAQRGLNWPGIAAAAVFTAALGLKRWPRTDLVAVAASGVLGLIVESGFAASGLIRYAAPWPVTTLAPAWIIALWIAFGATLGGVRQLLGPQWRVRAALTGLVGGPFSYWAAARLGALEIVAAPWAAYLAIALIWGIALPLLLSVRQRLAPEIRT